MSDEITLDDERRLAALTPDAWRALVARVRPVEESDDPRVRAALALQQYRGHGLLTKDSRRIDASNPAPSSKEEAVAALRAVMGHHSVTTEGTD